MVNPSRYYHIVEKPLLTEKSTFLQDVRNQYCFRVHPKANKSEIRKAIEALFDVRVEKVNIINNPGKIRRILGRQGRSAPWKKAIVTLPEGQRLELI